MLDSCLVCQQVEDVGLGCRDTPEKEATLLPQCEMVVAGLVGLWSMGAEDNKCHEFMALAIIDTRVRCVSQSSLKMRQQPMWCSQLKTLGWPAIQTCDQLKALLRTDCQETLLQSCGICHIAATASFVACNDPHPPAEHCHRGNQTHQECALDCCLIV